MPGDFDLVKERVDIVQLVSERVPLRKAGRTYKGLCPFHNEKTPSFTVDPERRTYHCFGCGEQGDIFDWVVKQEGVDKVDALKSLAERAGVQLSTRPKVENEHVKRLLAAHDTAHFYFRQALRSPLGAAAAKYLAEDRGLSAVTIDRFGLGFAPESRDGLLQYLRKKGFNDDEAVSSGLVLSHERGLFDRFHARLMIPIRDSKARIIAFAGRTMIGHPAKYINSPQTALFNKGSSLFALDVARPAIRKAGEAVVVEGQFDAISCHQAGLDNIVGSQGTAFTPEQYRMLDALKIAKVVVAFDADAAGKAAAEKRGRDLFALVAYEPRRRKAGDIELQYGARIYVAEVSGEPDQLARTDPEALRTTFAAPKPVLEYVIDRIKQRHDLSSADGRRGFLSDTLPLLAKEPEPITRDLYLGALSRLTGVAEETLRAEVKRTPAAVTTPARVASSVRLEAPAPPAEPPREVSSVLERSLMAQLVQFPEEAARVDLAPTDLIDLRHRVIYEHLRDRHPSGDLPAHLAATVAALGAPGAEPESVADAGRKIEILALRLREQNLRRLLAEAREKLARATGGDVGALDDEVARLAGELEAVMKQREHSTVLRAEMEIE